MWGGEARVNKNMHKNFADAAKTLTMTKFEVRVQKQILAGGPRIHSYGASPSPYWLQPNSSI